MKSLKTEGKSRPAVKKFGPINSFQKMFWEVEESEDSSEDGFRESSQRFRLAFIAHNNGCLNGSQACISY